LTDHSFDNNLHNPCQSANIKERFTETKLLSVYDDIININSVSKLLVLLSFTSLPLLIQLIALSCLNVYRRVLEALQLLDLG
jgi:hypothetical protein